MLWKSIFAYWTVDGNVIAKWPPEKCATPSDFVFVYASVLLCSALVIAVVLQFVTPKSPDYNHFSAHFDHFLFRWIRFYYRSCCCCCCCSFFSGQYLRSAYIYVRDVKSVCSYSILQSIFVFNSSFMWIFLFILQFRFFFCFSSIENGCTVAFAFAFSV